ncbi:DUF4349 domain-containing protein [Cohnella cholangitidis]|uniref:DUF4349 domain-containing protein n=1 Tax=Cohnella cholangitidis TaxID=2598458 RepID=A0A7G5BTV6_9BACL|nr:DUF4349 domain-containing protein [Cohnella cholangitidis]QMV40390.1 DUF4349 domain-containing protein [Cohnella cholangitidis]
MKGKRDRVLRNGVLMMLAILLMLGLAACGGSSNDKDSAAAEMAAPDAAANQSIKTTSAQSAAFSDAESGELAKGPERSDAGESESEEVAAVGGGGIGPIADANAGFGRKVIYRADLVMKVKEFKAAEEQLLNLIHMGGAYVLQFSDSRNSDEVGASYVIKVPSDGFSPFLEKLQKIKSLKFEREVEGSDVTEEFVDLDARLKAKQTVEARLLSLMDKATKSDDLVRFSNELANVQQEIEQIKGRIRFLDQNVAFSTINLRLYQSTGIANSDDEETEEVDGFGERISDTFAGSAKVLKTAGEWFVIVIVALLPVIAVVAVIGFPIYYFVRRRKGTRRVDSEIESVSDSDDQENKDGTR